MSRHVSRRALVTGGSGFIGSRLASRLLDLGWAVTILDLVAPRIAGVEHLPGSIADPIMLARLTETEYDVVFHLAWSTKPASANRNPGADIGVNVLGGIAFLDALTRSMRPPRLFFVSTGGAVYGVPEPGPIAEEHCTNPFNAYGISKLTFEHYLRLYRHLYGLDYLVFRPGNPYGEGQDPKGSQGAVTVFLGRLARGLPIEIWGDGSVTRDYLHIDDLVAALVAGIDHHPPQDGPRIFNVGSGVGLSLTDIVAAIGEVTGLRPEVHHLPARKVDVPAIVLDCGLIRAAMGWTPQVGLAEGLARTWQWVRQNPR